MQQPARDEVSRVRRVRELIRLAVDCISLQNSETAKLRKRMYYMREYLQYLSSFTRTLVLKDL